MTITEANGLSVPVETWLAELVEAGLVVSLAYGNCGQLGVMWSVDVLNTKTAETFDKPYGANNLRHACEIAVIESRERGWIP